MKIDSQNTETTITIDISFQDLNDLIKNLLPAEWKYYSIDIQGLGVSKGAKIIVKHSDFMEK